MCSGNIHTINYHKFKHLHLQYVTHNLWKIYPLPPFFGCIQFKKKTPDDWCNWSICCLLMGENRILLRVLMFCLLKKKRSLTAISHKKRRRNTREIVLECTCVVGYTKTVGICGWSAADCTCGLPGFVVDSLWQLETVEEDICLFNFLVALRGFI